MFELGRELKRFFAPERSKPSADGRRWTPKEVLQYYHADKPLHIWFCGPAAMGRQLRRELKQTLPAKSWTLHKEHFQFR